MYGSTETTGQIESVTESTSSNTRLFVPSPPPPYEERRTYNAGSWEFSLFWTKILFAFVAVLGQVGQDISLHLWLDCSNGTTSLQKIDNYFVLSFGSLSFVVISGFGVLFIRIVFPRHLGETERRFPQLSLFIIGLCSALNGALAVFASNSKRTPLYLQMILATLMIPSTILFRRLILRKRPTLRKLLCAVVVTVVPVLCVLIPTTFPKIREFKTSGGVLWPWSLVFAISFVPATVMNVLEEKAVKVQNEMSRRGINLFYFFFWVSLHQLLCVGLLIWLDILPWYGNAGNMQVFGKNWKFGVQCFFGADCDTASGTIGTVFIFMYVLSYVGGVNLLRHAEGATWVAVVTSLVTPLRVIFWSLFSEVSCKWQPNDAINAVRGVSALALMFPAIIIYAIGEPEVSLNDQERTSR